MKKRKIKIKIKRPKRRIPVAPPGFPHKDQKRYDRERDKKRPERTASNYDRLLRGAMHVPLPMNKNYVVHGAMVNMDAYYDKGPFAWPSRSAEWAFPQKK